MAKVRLKLKPFFKRESILLRGNYRRLLQMKKGIRNDKAPKNKESTAEAKGFNHWLINTGETKKKGIKVASSRVGMKVYASKGKHSGDRIYMGVPGGYKGRKRGVQRRHTEKRKVNYGKGPTYVDLYTWHNKGGDRSAMYNETERYSGIFQKWPVGSKFPDRLAMAVRKDIRKHLKREIKRAY